MSPTGVESGRTLVATTSAKAGTSGRSRRQTWRRSLPGAVATIAGVVAVATAVSGAVLPLSGPQFLPAGHWVYNSAQQAAFHVDGATTNFDARVPVAGDTGSQVVQGDTNGYVVGQNRITQFGKSNLKVERTIVPPANETPVALEAVGGPYLIYRQAGKVVRLGATATVISTGGRVADPVVTNAGTLWLLHPDNGLLCSLPKDAARIAACPAKVPDGHSGALTVIADQPHILDTTDGTLSAVSASGLGKGLKLGVPTSATTQIAAADANGRLAILDAAKHTLYIVDSKADPKAAAKPVEVALPPGTYEGPVASGGVVAVVDHKTNTLFTYDISGKRRDAMLIPASDGTPSMTRGADGRIYVQDGAGTHLLLVDKDGKVSDVPVVAPTAPNAPPSSPASPPSPSPTPGPQDPSPTPSSNPEPHPQPPADTTPPSNPGPEQPAPPAVPASAPGAPRSVSAKAGAGSATISWQAAAANRADITSYKVSWSGGSTTVSGGSRKATVTGLTNGQSYVLSVAAVNRVGQGPAVAAGAVTPAAAATAPGGFSASYDSNMASLSWSQPNLRGGTLVHYTVTATGLSSKTVTGTSTSFAMFPSPGQRLSFTVRAVTNTAAGQLTGATASTSVTVPVKKKPSVEIGRGSDTHSDSCKSPSCAWIDVTLTDFEPNTKVTVTAYGNGNDFSDPCVTTTDSSGSATCNDIRYDVPGADVYVTAKSGSDTVESNHITWGRG